MSTDYYICCDKCKKKISIASDGFSGFQLWYTHKETGDALKNMLADCVFHIESLRFCREQEERSEDYIDL